MKNFLQTKGYPIMQNVQPENQACMVQPYSPLGHLPFVQQQNFAARKRFFVPLWWLESYLLQNGQQYGFHELFQNFSQTFYLGPEIPAKYFPYVCAIWTHFIGVAIQNNSIHQQSMTLRLDKLLRGTQDEISEQLIFLRSYWTSPYEIENLEQALSKRRKKITKVCNFITQCTLELNEHATLCITFAESLQNFIQPNQAVTHGVVSLNPDILWAKSRGKSLKPLLFYLCMEYTKSRQQESLDQWHALNLTAEYFPQWHKDIMSQTKNLYDHGILSWDESIPRTRIRVLKQHMLIAGSPTNSIIYLWKAADQVHDATLIEAEIAKRILSKPKTHEKTTTPLLNESKEQVSPKATVVPATKQKQTQTSGVTSQKLTASPKTLAPSKRTLYLCSSQSKELSQQQPHCQAQAAQQQQSSPKLPRYWTDESDEFLERLAKAYARLPKTSVRMLERERKFMKPMQFQIYAKAILADV